MSYNDTERVSVDPAFAIMVADAGTMLPRTPELQTSLRGRYDFTLDNGWDAHWQLGVKYAGEAVNSLVDTAAEPNTLQDAYTLVNVTAGVKMSLQWSAQLFINNLTDERAQLHINRQDFFERTTTNRPRTVGLRISYDY